MTTLHSPCLYIGLRQFTFCVPNVHRTRAPLWAEEQCKVTLLPTRTTLFCGFTDIPASLTESTAIQAIQGDQLNCKHPQLQHFTKYFPIVTKFSPVHQASRMQQSAGIGLSLMLHHTSNPGSKIRLKNLEIFLEVFVNVKPQKSSIKVFRFCYFVWRRTCNREVVGLTPEMCCRL